jgi:PAS domain S-box-containing protein
MRRHDGEYRWMMVRTAEVRDGRGAVIGFVGIAADIHERLAAEAEATDAHVQLDAIWEATPVLALLDADLRFVRVNETMAAMGRVPAHEWTGKRPPEVLARVADHFREFSEELETTRAAILRREREAHIDGELFYRLDSWVPLYDAAGVLLGVAVVCEDITAQKRAQRMAEDALRELDAIYQGAPIGLAVMDRKLRFLRVNERLAEMNGAPVADHIGRTPADVIPGVKHQGGDAIRAVLQRGEAVLGLELSAESPDRPGEHGHYLENWVPLKNELGEVVGVSIAVADVTERQRGG